MALEAIKKAIEEEEKKEPVYDSNTKLKETIRVLKEEFGDSAAVILPQIMRITL
jgi:hypothetical protein